MQWERHVHRWIDRMANEHLSKDHWRKSSQWFALTRAHAQLVVDDTIIDGIFRKDCYPTREDGWCVMLVVVLHACLSSGHAHPCRSHVAFLQYKSFHNAELLNLTESSNSMLVLSLSQPPVPALMMCMPA